MNNKQAFFVGLGIGLIAIALLWWIKEQEILAKEKSLDEKDDRIQELELNNLTLIREILKQDTSLSQVVKDQLLDLISNYEIKNKKVADELKAIVNLIEIGEYEKSIMAITKIIEVILRNKFSKQPEFKKRLIKEDGRKRRAVFNDYIEHAQEFKLLTKSEYRYAVVLKDYRNEEAHELAVKRTLNYNVSSILTGIELIIKCDAISMN